MTALFKSPVSALRVIEYANWNGWMLGTYSEKGYVASNRLFIVCDHVDLSFDKLKVSIQQINMRATLGRGYVFEAFEEPCSGCEVEVSEGWELSTQAMKNDFLNRFVKALGLKEHE